MIVSNRLRQSRSIDNNCGLTPSRTGSRINSSTYFYLKLDGVSGDDLNAATESAVPTSTWCSVETMDLSCLVFEIWHDIQITRSCSHR